MGREYSSKNKIFTSILIPLAIGLLVALGTMWGFGQEPPAGKELGDFSLLEKERQLRGELEAKIQTDILDPIIGRGKAMVFVSVELDIETKRQKVVQSGAGYASKTESETAPLAQTEFLLPGIPKPKNLAEGPLDGKAQQAKQERGATEEKMTQRTLIKRMEILILHDEALPQDTLEMARSRIIDALRHFEVKPDQIVFKPTRMQGRLMDDLRQPAVYVPILFALMLFLFLLFLFGPMASFMRGYVKLLEKREGAEITMESEGKNTADEGEGGGMGGGAMGAMEGEMEALDKEKEGGEDEMQRFEPFKYINEQNLKGLIFLLKREEPWIISVVLTYLKAELAQKVLQALPLEVQARAAMETAIIREVTREQVVAIDQQIKERVDFVVGGIEPLLKMLEDCRADIRDSILEYLKNERPEVYDKIRKRLLLFEDLPSIPDKILAQVARELKPSEIAIALKSAPPEIEAKVFANLSSGAVNLVKEEMELNAEVSVESVAKERQKIIGIIKKLETEGKITFREKPQATVIEGIEEDQGEAAQRLRDWREQWREKMPQAGGLGPTESQGLERPISEAAPASQASAPKPESLGPDALYEQGLSLYNQGRYEEAERAFQSATLGRENFWQAHQGLGSCRYAQGRIAQALESYERALKLNPSPELEEFVRSMRVQAGT